MAEQIPPGMGVALPKPQDVLAAEQQQAQGSRLGNVARTLPALGYALQGMFDKNGRRAQAATQMSAELLREKRAADEYRKAKAEKDGLHKRTVMATIDYFQNGVGITDLKQKQQLMLEIASKWKLDDLGAYQTYMGLALPMMKQQADAIDARINGIKGAANRAGESGEKDYTVSAEVAKDIPTAAMQAQLPDSVQNPDGSWTMPTGAKQEFNEEEFTKRAEITAKARAKYRTPPKPDKPPKPAATKLTTIMIAGKPHRVEYDPNTKQITKDLDEAPAQMGLNGMLFGGGSGVAMPDEEVNSLATTPKPPKPTSDAVATKTVNGKKYVKKSDGMWYPAE